MEEMFLISGAITVRKKDILEMAITEATGLQMRWFQNEVKGLVFKIQFRLKNHLICDEDMTKSKGKDPLEGLLRARRLSAFMELECALNSRFSFGA